MDEETKNAELLQGVTEFVRTQAVKPALNGVSAGSNAQSGRPRQQIQVKNWIYCNSLTEKGEVMKRTVFLAIAVSLMVLFVAACQQEVKQTDQQKQAQITEMMQDSTMVSMMMDHIASDYHLQSLMMQKMIEHAKSDRTAMTQIGKMMTDDMEMRSLVQKMTGEEMMKKDSSMMHDMDMSQKK